MPIDVPLDVTQLDQYVLIKNAESPDPVPVRNPSTGVETLVPLAQLVGPPPVVVVASPDVTTKIGGATATSPKYLAGIRGYPVLAGPTGKQWMIAPLITAAVGAAFNGIPGGSPPGWVNAEARQTFVNYGLALINPPYNADPQVVVEMLAALYLASLAEDDARDAANG